MDVLKRLKLFQKIRAEIEDPQAECDGIVLYLNTSARKILGMDVLSLDFSFVNPRYIFLLTIMTSFLYADLEAAVLADDIGGFAYNIAVLGFGLQGFAKFDAYVYRKKLMYDLVWQCSAFLGKNKGHDRFSTFLVDNVAVIMIVNKFYYRLYGLVRWYPAIVICFAASFQIFTLSLLGTLLLIKGEELIQQVYDINWYNLDLPVQKSLKLLLLISQNNKEISYRFGVMNMETFVQSHKLVYSFFTMLVTTKE
ncbi:hypothetical protein RP20_CCG013368 [Aedes albopictus]|nr:hypothetical protein RP20_CCG013368 [Aedes albopictus]